MDNKLQLIPGRQNPIEFDVNIEGTSGSEVDVRILIYNKDENQCILVHGEKREDRTWGITIPALREKEDVKFKIEVIADGYHFEVHHGEVEFVQPVEVKISEPKIKNKALEKAAEKEKVKVNVDSKEEKKDNKPEEPEEKEEPKEEKKKQVTKEELTNIFGSASKPRVIQEEIPKMDKLIKDDHSALLEQIKKREALQSILESSGVKVARKPSFSSFLNDES